MRPKTEFYEVAVRSGFYGVDRSGLHGKKDNVRKFWEDMSIKLWLRPVVEALLARRPRLRVIDLGCGAGEGFELLSNIPARHEQTCPDRDVLISPSEIGEYVGVDLSRAMVSQGTENYRGARNVRFEVADLSAGLPLRSATPFDLYFSSYGSMSHLTATQLERLCAQVCAHAAPGASLVIDLLGRHSPEWPRYWNQSCEQMLPYTMAYLLAPEERQPERIEWFRNSFWTAPELRALVERAAAQAGRTVEFTVLSDRSIFVGRHMELGLLGGPSVPTRLQVNRLLDHGYRGQVSQLRIDLTPYVPYLEFHPLVWDRLRAFAGGWNTVIELLDALMARRDADVRRLIETTEAPLADDLRMLAWLGRNGLRFPVADYWASVIGPQVAVVLRNLEMGLPDALGCGHALFAIVKIGGPVPGADG